MISPEHVVEQKPENEQVSSPTQEQQVLPASEKKRPWLKPLMRATGIVLALVGSFAILWLNIVVLPNDLAYIWLEALLLGAISAALYLSWWAVLEIPIAFVAGEFVAFFLIPQLINPNFFEIGDNGLVYLWAIAGPITVTWGAFIGSYFGVQWKKRLQL